MRRIDVLFEIERTINGRAPEQRLAVRREKSRPLVADLEIWMRQQQAMLSSNNDTAKAINYLLNCWAAFTGFLDDGRVCLSNNAAERALRGVAVGRKNWTFADSDAGGHRAAAIYSLIETCKMNDVEFFTNNAIRSNDRTATSSSSVQRTIRLVTAGLR